MIYAKIIDMNIVPNNRAEWTMFLMDNDKKDVIIKRETGTRSDSQNNYLWGVVYKVISDYNGDTVNSLHEYFKRTLLPPQFIKVMGKEIKIPASTTKLNKSEFAEYVMRIGAEVAPLGVIIPSPEKDEAHVEVPELTVMPKF
jgi:hypothetical protein